MLLFQSTEQQQVFYKSKKPEMMKERGKYKYTYWWVIQRRKNNAFSLLGFFWGHRNRPLLEWGNIWRPLDCASTVPVHQEHQQVASSSLVLFLSSSEIGMGTGVGGTYLCSRSSLEAAISLFWRVMDLDAFASALCLFSLLLCPVRLFTIFTWILIRSNPRNQIHIKQIRVSKTNQKIIHVSLAKLSHTQPLPVQLVHSVEFHQALNRWFF